MSLEPEPHPTDPTDRINGYVDPSNCYWCKSDKIVFPVSGFMACNNCGKHALYGERFFYMEERVSVEDITIEMIKQAIIDAAPLYDTKNREQGSKYYFLNEITKRM